MTEKNGARVSGLNKMGRMDSANRTGRTGGMSRQGRLDKLVELSHCYIGQVLREGHAAVDATGGKGYDTLFMAGLVGQSGRVYVFDIQEEALRGIAGRLEKEGMRSRAVLIHAGHEEMEEFVVEPVRAVMFNLGYLPGGNHNVVTRPETTLAGLRAALKLLASGGRLSVVAYRGHRGGLEEALAVEEILKSLDKRKYSTIKIELLNRVENAPVLFVAEKAGDSGR